MANSSTMVGTSRKARLTRDGVKGSHPGIIAGGTEISAVTMEWALMELLRRPDAAAVATEELYRVVGSTGGGELGGRRWSRRAVATGPNVGGARSSVVVGHEARRQPASGDRISGARSPIKEAYGGVVSPASGPDVGSARRSVAVGREVRRQPAIDGRISGASARFPLKVAHGGVGERKFKKGIHGE